MASRYPNSERKGSNKGRKPQEEREEEEEEEEEEGNPDNFKFKSHGVIAELKRGEFRRQRRFALEDSLYHIKIRAEDKKTPSPHTLISALQIMFMKILAMLRKRYGHERRRQAYISIYGGTYYKPCKIYTIVICLC